MLPLLSKIVTFFLSPANWILVLALLFLIGKPGKWKRRYGIVLVTITILFTNPGLFYVCLQSWQPAFIPATGKFEAVILPADFPAMIKMVRVISDRLRIDSFRPQSWCIAVWQKR